MRINVADTNLFRTTSSLNAGNRQKNTNQPLAWNRPDSFSFSSMAGKLCIQGKSVSSWEEKITKPTDGRTLQIIENQMSVIGNLLEQQKKLTEIAKDESLSDLDRIDLQIEMEALQKTLTAETRRMSMTMAGMSSSEINNELAYFLSSSDTLGWERARERILNGEDWDVAETFEIARNISEVKTNVLGSGEVLIAEINKDMSGDIVVTKGESIPTISEKLKILNGINLMDAKSASKGSERIDKQIENLAKMKQEFIGFYEQYGGTPQTGQSEIQADINIGDRLELNQTRRTVETTLGTMSYSTKSNGAVDLSDPRLQNPNSPLGSLFSKVESLFKDQIGKNLGAFDPFDGRFINKIFTVGPAKN